MNVLVLGGTGFIGRHVVLELLAAGHHVSSLARGVVADELPACVERLHADRDDGAATLAPLHGRNWDACVDTSGYTPRQVRPSAELLRGAHYVYVSAVSVYGDPPQGPVDETFARQPPAADDVTVVDGSTYGALKVACEDIVLAAHGERATLLRPQIVVGPGDPSGRYAWWVERAACGGPMLAPGDGSDWVQVIDVRNVARFVRRAVEHGIGGVFDLAGPRQQWRDFVRMLGAAEPVWVSADMLDAAGLTFIDLPLYRRNRGSRSSLMHVSAERALQAGLAWSAPERTLADVRAWLDGREPTAGFLSQQRVAALIAQAP